MNPVLRDTLDLLDVERIEENLYRGRNAGGSQHVFSGQALAQAIGAANRTIDAGHAGGYVGPRLHEYVDAAAWREPERWR